MRRTTLVAAILAASLVLLPASAHALKWKYPLYSVVHASDGLGLTDGSLSLHRAFSSRHAMLDSFTIYSTTYTWTRPADSTFLIAPWTSTSVTACGDCHATISMGGSTPASGYPDPYESLRLDDTTANGMSSTTVICAKCHDLVNGTTWSNIVHDSDKHRDGTGQCVSCHLQLPHGGGLPRLLGYAQDPSPYSTLATGLAGIRLQSYTPTSWRKSDCTSACHARSFTSWPSGGSIAGTVHLADGSAAVNATVTVGPQQTKTSATGTYRIDNVGVGYTNARFDLPGYATGAANAAITGGAVWTADATLTPAP